MRNGDNDIPYGSCIFEAHVMTTLQENYYKWLFLLLSDVDEVKDEHFEERFRMEYECGDVETGEMPEELIDYQDTNTRLRPDLEIHYDDKENDKRRLFKVTTNAEEMETIRRKEREALEALVYRVRKDHQKMIQRMREKVTTIRDMKRKSRTRDNHMSDEEIKKLVSVEKRRLIQFRSEEKTRNNHGHQPDQKRRKVLNDHKSRCSDMKVQCFQQTKEMLDREESEGLIASWERIYKYIINKHVKDTTNDVEPVMKEPSKMLNELGKAVDLDEIMNETANL